MNTFDVVGLFIIVFSVGLCATAIFVPVGVVLCIIGVIVIMRYGTIMDFGDSD